jgi:hypothetical protein
MRSEDEELNAFRLELAEKVLKTMTSLKERLKKSAKNKNKSIQEIWKRLAYSDLYGPLEPVLYTKHPESIIVYGRFELSHCATPSVSPASNPGEETTGNCSARIY